MFYPEPEKPLEEQEPRVLLALLGWGEARGEGPAGIYAVQCVARNRQLQPQRFGDTLAKVILKPWAFSCFNQGDPNRDKLLKADHLDLQSWQEAAVLAELCLNGGPDPTKGATHYCTTSMWAKGFENLKQPPWYSANLIVAGVTQERSRIGNHVFAVTDLKPTSPTHDA